jgi:hypothetical protein
VSATAGEGRGDHHPGLGPGRVAETPWRVDLLDKEARGAEVDRCFWRAAGQERRPCGRDRGTGGENDLGGPAAGLVRAALEGTWVGPRGGLDRVTRLALTRTSRCNATDEARRERGWRRGRIDRGRGLGRAAAAAPPSGLPGTAAAGILRRAGRRARRIHADRRERPRDRREGEPAGTEAATMAGHGEPPTRSRRFLLSTLRHYIARGDRDQFNRRVGGAGWFWRNRGRRDIPQKRQGPHSRCL